MTSKSKKDKIKQGNLRDFDLLYDTLVNGGTYSDYRSELLDRSMPQELLNFDISEDDILAAWILGKDEESELYAKGGHIAQFGPDSNWYAKGKFDSTKGAFQGAGNSIMSGLGIASTLGGWAGDFINSNNEREDANEKINANLRDISSQTFGVGDTGYLASQYNGIQRALHTSAEDNGAYSTSEGIINLGKDAMTGAMTGLSVGGPWGALIGGAVGLGKAAVLWAVNNSEAKEQARINNLLADIANNQTDIRFGDTVSNSNKLYLHNQLSQPYMAACGGKMKNKLASGGYINSHYDYITDPLVRVEAGGTHQENPNEGVLTSIAPDGQPNLVEENETIINNQDGAYVFSDRIIADDEILKSHLLPNKFAGKTYADISKELDKIIEEHKNDEISKRTFDEMISRLQQALEDQKFQEKQEEVEKFLGGLTDEQKEQLEQTMVEEAQAEQQAAEEQAIAEQQAQELAAAEQGMSELAPEQAQEQVAMEQPEELIVPSRYDQMMSRALFTDAADLGMFYKGGHLALDGKRYYGKNFLWGDGDEPEEKQINSFYNPERESYSSIILSQPIEGLAPIIIDTTTKYNVPGKRNIVSINDSSLPAPSDDEIAEAGWRLGLFGNWTNKPKSNINWSTYLRFAPAVGSGVLYLSDLFGVTNRNDYTNPNLFQRSINAIPNVGFTPIGGYRTFNPFDETFQLNALRSMNEAARRTVINNSNGNYGATLAALDALNYNTSGQLGDLALKAREYNEKERQAIDEYNLKINQINASLSMTTQEKNQAIAALKARLTAALAEMRQQIEDTNDAAKSANMTNFYQNVGNIGKENFNMTMVRTNPAFYYTITDDGQILYKNGFSGLNERDQAFVRSVAEPQAEEQRKKHLEETNKKADETMSPNRYTGLYNTYLGSPYGIGLGFGFRDLNG